MWVNAGDEALFMRHSFHSFGDPHTHGWVRDEDVVAHIHRFRPGEPFPANDWVMIRQDPDEPDPSAAIAYAEEWRPKPTHGTILDYGPGKPVWTGPLQGTRKPVQWLVTAEHRDIVGKRVWWGRDHEMLSVGREHLEALFIRAEELLFFEED